MFSRRQLASPCRYPFPQQPRDGISFNSTGTVFISTPGIYRVDIKARAHPGFGFAFGYIDVFMELDGSLLSNSNSRLSNGNYGTGSAPGPDRGGIFASYIVDIPASAPIPHELTFWVATDYPYQTVGLFSDTAVDGGHIPSFTVSISRVGD